MSATILLVVHSDGLTFDLNLIARHLLSEYVLLLIGLLIAVDVFLDTYVIRNKEGFFWKFARFGWGLVFVTAVIIFFGGVGAMFVSEIMPEIVKIAAIFALFLLFLVRFLSYVKVKSVRPIHEVTPVDAG